MKGKRVRQINVTFDEGDSLLEELKRRKEKGRRGTTIVGIVREALEFYFEHVKEGGEKEE